MPTPEGHVLKPVESSVTNSDEWETFTLSNAQVVYESNGKPASLLAAYADTPLKVQGTFTPGRGQLKYRTSFDSLVRSCKETRCWTLQNGMLTGDQYSASPTSQPTSRFGMLRAFHTAN
jgi:hypothetical protein